MLLTTEKEFNRRYLQRIRQMREDAGFSRQDMANALGVQYETYKKYETRSPLPPHLIPPFAQLTHNSIARVVTGLDEAPSKKPGDWEAA